MAPLGLTRRKVLQSVGVCALSGVAGCLSGIDQGERDSPGPEVSFNAEILQTFTDDHPARIHLEFSNESDEMLLFLTQEGGPSQGGMFGEVWGHHRDSDDKLLLLRDDVNCRTEVGTPSAIPETPTGDSDIAESKVDGCWRPPCDELFLYHFAPAWEEFPPEEPRRDEYVVLDGLNGGCLPAGTYDFTATGLIARGELTDDEGKEFHSERYKIYRRLTVSLDEPLDITASAEAIVTSRDASDSDSDTTPQETPYAATQAE